MTSKEKAQDARLRRVYKSSLEDNRSKLEEQGHKCAICDRAFPKFQAYQDHDHKCCPRPRGKKGNNATFCGRCNRGLLCYLCNKFVMGIVEKMKMADDSPFDVQRLAAYITKWKTILTAKGCYESKGQIQKKSRPKRTT